MGLSPLDLVPDPLLLLEDAERLDDTFDQASGTVVVEAAGIRELPMSEIVARHGTVIPLPEDERSFKVGFVVVSAEPAGDDVLAAVASWAAIFGGREEHQNFESFATLLGDRARADTRRSHCLRIGKSCRPHAASTRRA